MGDNTVNNVGVKNDISPCFRTIVLHVSPLCKIFIHLKHEYMTLPPSLQTQTPIISIKQLNMNTNIVKLCFSIKYNYGPERLCICNYARKTCIAYACTLEKGKTGFILISFL